MMGWLRWAFGQCETARPIIEDDVFDAVLRAQCRPISRADQSAARDRLNPDNWPFILVDIGGGTAKFYPGTLDARDYTLRDGYVIHPSGTDRYGWPVGHPDSPATTA